jgi:hypothetical protein
MNMAAQKSKWRKTIKGKVVTVYGMKEHGGAEV